MKKYSSLIILLFSIISVYAQFAPPAGKVGTTAMHKDSSAFIAWATNCSLDIGNQNIANPSLGKASIGSATSAIGKAGSNGVVSLGDGGSATLTFANPIVNGKGYDFAVFENGFNANSDGDFLELAFVEVSSDGVNFVRFSSVSNTQNITQVASEGILDASKINNLAGKYVATYGTPFDLEELKDSPGLNLNNITHVRIIDVIGSILEEYASNDSEGNIINDPWPTGYAASGFDLDAVGVINSSLTSLSQPDLESLICVYPNPVKVGDKIKINSKREALEGSAVQIIDLNGKIIEASILTEDCFVSTAGLPVGVYMLKIGAEENQMFKRLIIGM